MRRIGTARQYGVLFLVVAFLLPGFPRFSPEDVNRDHQVDLRDTLLQVRAFSEGVQADGRLTDDFRKVLSSLYVAAGLKTVIKAEKPMSLTPGVSADFPFVMAEGGFLPVFSAGDDLPIQNQTVYTSFFMDLDTPPPRNISL